MGAQTWNRGNEHIMKHLECWGSAGEVGGVCQSPWHVEASMVMSAEHCVGSGGFGGTGD